MQAVATAADVDFIQEIRLRTWARANYVPADEREHSWHPIILEEMRSKDEDSLDASALCAR